MEKILIICAVVIAISIAHAEFLSNTPIDKDLAIIEAQRDTIERLIAAKSSGMVSQAGLIMIISVSGGIGIVFSMIFFRHRERITRIKYQVKFPELPVVAETRNQIEYYEDWR